MPLSDAQIDTMFEELAKAFAPFQTCTDCLLVADFRVRRLSHASDIEQIPSDAVSDKLQLDQSSSATVYHPCRDLIQGPLPQSRSVPSCTDSTPGWLGGT